MSKNKKKKMSVRRHHVDLQFNGQNPNQIGRSEKNSNIIFSKEIPVSIKL